MSAEINPSLIVNRIFYVEHAAKTHKTLKNVASRHLQAESAASKILCTCEGQIRW